MNVSLRAAVAILAQSLFAVAQAQVQPPSMGAPSYRGPVQDPARPQGAGGQQPGTQGPEAVVPGTQLPGARNPLQVRWTTPNTPTFQGFPVFPSQLSGYGEFPSAGGVPSLPLVPAADEPPGWPAWARTRDKEPLPYAPELALLIRHVDRVWQRAAADEPFVPLYFHDKFRTLQPGAAVEVRQNGEFELLLHSSTRLVSRGPSRIELAKLTPTDVHLQVYALTWMRIGAMDRAHTIELPDGSILRIATPAPATVPAFLPLPIPMSAPLPGVTELVIARADEPEWLGGRATLTNLGSTEVRWQHAGGDVVLLPSHRVTFFLQPPRQRLGAELEVRGASVEKVDATVVCRAAGDGRATWSGASFELPPGAQVRFDPQQGRPFEPKASQATTTPAPR